MSVNDKKEKIKSKRKALNMKQISRYSRQIILEKIGTDGQQKLLSSHVLIVGAGGLGCPSAQMLASAGIGKITIADFDIVDISNLPRQILHFTKDVGKYKVDSIKEKINELNPDVIVNTIHDRITKENIEQLLKDVDYVIEASDNLATKFLINDACVYHQIPFTIAGAVEFYGQIISVNPPYTTCYRCVFLEPGNEDPNMSCSGAGVLNTVPNFAGVLEANEAIMKLAGLNQNIVNKLFCFDLGVGSFDYVSVKQRASCPVCNQSKKKTHINEKSRKKNGDIEKNDKNEGEPNELNKIDKKTLELEKPYYKTVDYHIKDTCEI